MDNQIKNFISKHNRDLIQIYIKESQTHGEGILLINKTNNKNVDVGYVKLELLEKEVLNFILERKKINKPSIAYFYIINKTINTNNTEFLELDLDIQ